MYVAPVVRKHVCTLCDKNFVRRYHLQRHKDTVHSSYKMNENSKTNSGTESEDSFDSESEREVSETEMEGDESSNEEESSDAETSNDELEENAAYQEWYVQAKEATEEMKTEKYEKYVQAGMGEEEASEKANVKTAWAVKRFFFNQFEIFLTFTMTLQDDDTYRDIVADIEEKLNKGVDMEKAVKRVLIKYKDKFEALFQQDVVRGMTMTM